MNENLKVPVFIITGFLGSGKTTFLNQLIKENRDKRVFVIENEVGKVNIDSTLIQTEASDIMELTAGCLCCNLNDKLYEILVSVLDRRAEYDILVIETTGIADPSGVVETFWIDGYMERNFEVRSTICLADAKYFQESLDQTEEARRQITFSDVVLVNKMDEVTEMEADEIQFLIQDINPGVQVYLGSFGQFPTQKILEFNAHQKHRSEMLAKTIDRNLVHKHKGINTFTLKFDRPFEDQRLKHTLMLLISINKEQIYRIKGIVHIDGIENKVIIQSVFRSFRIEEGSAWEDTEEKQSKIVFIGNHVEKASIERIFNQCLIKEEPSVIKPST